MRIRHAVPTDYDPIIRANEEIRDRRVTMTLTDGTRIPCERTVVGLDTCTCVDARVGAVRRAPALGVGVRGSSPDPPRAGSGRFVDRRRLRRGRGARRWPGAFAKTSRPRGVKEPGATPSGISEATLREVTENTVRELCNLSVRDDQRRMVPRWASTRGSASR